MNNTYYHFFIFNFIYYYNLLLGIYNNYFNNRGAYVTLVIFQPLYCTFNHPLTFFFFSTSPLFYVYDYLVIFRYQPVDEYLLRVTKNFSVITYFNLSMTFLSANTILFL